MTGQNIARYEVLGPLGQGGMGLVYKARDSSLDRLVALKVLNPKRAENCDRVARFAMEAKAASALNHPNIITVYEIDRAADGSDFIAMEYVDGLTLHSLAAQPVPIPTLISIARQVAEALSVAHARGIVHRDIKPENIMVRRDGYVKILDFGLARLRFDDVATMDTITHAGDVDLIAGTPAYMAPEQALGGALTAAADIFSFGLVLYQIATGRHPFPALTNAAVIQAIMTQAVIPPSHLRPEIPKSLEELILAMLNKDPARRPSAAAISEILAEPSGQSSQGILSVARSAGRVTVGRDKELAEIHSCLKEASDGSGMFLFVTGEPGIGKTTLIEEFLQESSDVGPCVGRGRCSERLAGSEAYLPILEALEDLLRAPMGSQWAQMLKLFAPTWYLQVAPSSSDPSNLLRAEAQGASQERMKREITSFFQEVSRIRPLILFFDDLHWADVSTVDVLAYLGDRCRSLRILILATYRPTDLLLSKSPLRRVKLELQARGACREIVVGFLGPSEIERYLAFSFPGHRLPVEFPALIHSRTEGNPLFIVDLLRYLRDKGILVEAQGGGQWTLAQPMENLALGLPESVRSMIQRKIERLEEQDRRLLTCASVQGYEFDTAVVACALQMDPAEVEERLDGLERVHFFVSQIRETTLPDGTPTLRYQFVHALYQNSLYEALRPTRRAAMSKELARALVGFYGEKSAEIASSLAFLCEAAREPARAINYYLLAARHAAQVSANQEAVNLSRRGLKLADRLPASPERSQAEVALLTTFAICESVLKGYTNPGVEKAFSRAYDLCRDFEDRPGIVPVLTGLGAYSFMRPNLDHALEIMERLFHLTEFSPLPEPKVWVQFVAGSVKSHAGDLTAALRHEEASIALYDPARHIELLLQFGLDPGAAAYAQAARIAWILGLPDRSSRLVDEALAVSGRLPHEYTRAFVLFFSAVVSYYRIDAIRCLDLSAQLHALASENAFPMFLGWGGPVYGWAEAEAGNTDSGIQRIRQGLDLGRRIGTGLMRPEHLGMLASVLARCGKMDEALSTLDEAIETSECTKEIFCLPELLRMKAEYGARNSSASTPKSEELLRKAIRIAREMHAWSFELRSALSLGRLLSKDGREEEGREAVNSVYGKFTEGFDTPDLQAARQFLSSPPMRV